MPRNQKTPQIPLPVLVHRFLRLLSLSATQGVETVRLPPRSPNLSPHIERFMKTIKDGCLDLMIFFGEKSLRNAISEFLPHYHGERNHQGLDNDIIEPGKEVGRADGKIECRERLGGMLRYYYRDAA